MLLARRVTRGANRSPAVSPVAIHGPAQYSADKPAAVMVWQDGQGLVARDGQRAQIVFDNLTQEGKIPVIEPAEVFSGSDTQKI